MLWNVPVNNTLTDEPRLTQRVTATNSAFAGPVYYNCKITVRMN